MSILGTPATRPGYGLVINSYIFIVSLNSLRINIKYLYLLVFYSIINYQAPMTVIGPEVFRVLGLGLAWLSNFWFFWPQKQLKRCFSYIDLILSPSRAIPRKVMAFADSRNSGNPNPSDTVCGSGNGTSQHSVFSLCERNYFDYNITCK
jgi:hypothetical protein